MKAGAITFSRTSRNIMRISIRDSASRLTFVEVEMTPHDWAMAVTGLSEVEMEFETRGLANVGKRKIREPRQAVRPGVHHCRKDNEAWLLANGQETGWILDTHLGSQQSVVVREGQTLLNYGVYRYEEVA